MTESDPYRTAAAVENAIKDAARKALQKDPSLNVDRLIQQAYFNRFLCRVFSEREKSEWVLKGGTGILSRVPSARATRDIDLFRESFSLPDALDDLIRLSAIDLGDHFRFVPAGHRESMGNEAQPYADGCRVRFHVFLGAIQQNDLKVDLVVGPLMSGKAVSVTPANALDLPMLVNHPYRLYPVEDQIADKICATMAEYKSGPSSREKDLVDLVVFAKTQDVKADDLHVAIAAEVRRRAIPPFDQFTVPSSWRTGYVKQAKPVPHCVDHRTVGLASDLVGRFIDPVLSGEAAGKTWSHKDLDWR